MPIHDLKCRSCGAVSEVVTLGAGSAPTCPECGGTDVDLLMSASSTLTGKTPMRVPGPGDTACCGSTPSRAGCAGPGSCCGKGPAG